MRFNPLVSNSAVTYHLICELFPVRILTDFIKESATAFPVDNLVLRSLGILRLNSYLFSPWAYIFSPSRGFLKLKIVFVFLLLPFDVRLIETCSPINPMLRAFASTSLRNFKIVAPDMVSPGIYSNLLSSIFIFPLRDFMI